MADQVKYDSLPFIDSSGKDCFESGSEVSTHGNTDNVELTSEAVEHIHLDQSKSYNVFQNKYLDGSNIDFSDKLSHGHKGGYESKSVFEIIGEQVAKETPQQKYHRLQFELTQLAEEVEQIKDSVSSADKETTPVELSQQVKSLQKQLHDLHLEKILGTEALATGGIQFGTWTKQILNQLQAYKANPTAGKDGQSQDNIVYEMYYKPEHTKFAQAAKISELEGKIKQLEDYIGKDTQKLQSVISDPTLHATTLMDATACMQAKLTLFDVAHIEEIAARLQGLLHCINEISQKKSAIEDVNKQTKIAELHSLITSWDSVATIVPDLIERLKALQPLNEQATSFSQSLEHLNTTQADIRDQLRSQKDMLEKFEKSFAENVTSIQENCASLETRITNVMKKVGT